MAQIGEWSIFNNQEHACPRTDSFSLDFTLFSAGRMAQIGEWSRLRNHGNYSSLLEKNSLGIPLLMVYSLRE
jgi:hypothetical protein